MQNYCRLHNSKKKKKISRTKTTVPILEKWFGVQDFLKNFKLIKKGVTKEGPTEQRPKVFGPTQRSPSRTYPE